MASTAVDLPQAIGARVRVRSADQRGWEYLWWRGFRPEAVPLGGWYIMRREFADAVSEGQPEPPPPSFPIEIIS